MIVELASWQIQIRCTGAEYDDLSSGRAIELGVPLPGRHAIVINVDTVVVGGWRLEADPTGLWLTVPRSEIEGIAAPGGEVQVSHDFALETGGSTRVSLAFARADTSASS